MDCMRFHKLDTIIIHNDYINSLLFPFDGTLINGFYSFFAFFVHGFRSPFQVIEVDKKNPK